MSTLTVTGFGDSHANGVYTSTGTHDGETTYRLGSTNYYIRYSTKWGPYTNDANYYILKIADISSVPYVSNSAIPIEVPKYRIHGNVASSVTESWVAMVSNCSGEAVTGTVA
jgi:hypothetical protein